MRKPIFVLAISTILTWPAAALPPAPSFSAGLEVSRRSDLIEVKGGYGHGWGRGHGVRPFGWSRGRKVGWRGHGCPPGHWKKGWC